MLTASLQTIGNAAKKIISLIENSGEQIYRHESKSRKDDGYRDLFLPHRGQRLTNLSLERFRTSTKSQEGPPPLTSLSVSPLMQMA
jgi:hypothetical protein